MAKNIAASCDVVPGQVNRKSHQQDGLEALGMQLGINRPVACPNVVPAPEPANLGDFSVLKVVGKESE